MEIMVSQRKRKWSQRRRFPTVKQANDTGPSPDRTCFLQVRGVARGRGTNFQVRFLAMLRYLRPNLEVRSALGAVSALDKRGFIFAPMGRLCEWVITGHGKLLFTNLPSPSS
jgi:hypothetical protein